MAQYQPGDVMLRSKPFAFVILSSHVNSVCSWCWSRLESGNGLGCKACGLARYCNNNECEVAARNEHKEECGLLPATLSDQLRLVMRIWIKIRKSETSLVEENGNLRKSWEQLMDHKDELMNDSEELLLAQYNALAAVMKKADMPSREVFVEIYGKILTNSFSLRSDRYSSPEPFGTGVYLLASIFDHSCTPNSTVVFHGREMVVMATEEIPEGDLPNVAFISYVNSMDDTATRQLQQKAIWYFSCFCRLCKDNLLDREKHAIKCKKCEKGRPIDTNRWKVFGPCTNCCYRQDKEEKKQVERCKEIYELLTDYEPGGEGSSEMSYEDLCEWCLGEMEDVFSAGDILYVQTLHYVHTICMNSERWEAAANYGELALPSFKKYYGSNTGVVAALLVRLGEAYGEVGDHEKSRQHFEEADKIYKVIPGVEHPFYVQDFKPLLAKYFDH